uniref:Uncharacterized protein n=1 Tax=mine drainage metagenome TaxID=410659 RepID=E6QK82_9ZZZZ
MPENRVFFVFEIWIFYDVPKIGRLR